MEAASTLGAGWNRSIAALFSRPVSLVVSLHVAVIWGMPDQYRLGVLILVHILYAPVEFFTESTNQSLHDLSPSWTSMLLSLTCLIQFGVSLFIDSHYESRTGGVARYYYWMVWYPIVYWLINVGTTIVGSIRAIKKKRGQRAYGSQWTEACVINERLHY